MCPCLYPLGGELWKQCDFECCWVLTLPEDTRRSGFLQLFMFIYNAWPRVQYSFLEVHKHMHNLPEIPWEQTSHSTSPGGMCFARKFCWWHYCLQQPFQWFVKICKFILYSDVSTRLKFPPYIHHWDKNIVSQVMTTIQNQSRFHKP